MTVFILLSSFFNLNAAVTSVSKSTTQIIVPVYYSETADGGKKRQQFATIHNTGVTAVCVYHQSSSRSAESTVFSSLME